MVDWPTDHAPTIGGRKISGCIAKTANQFFCMKFCEFVVDISREITALTGEMGCPACGWRPLFLPDNGMGLSGPIENRKFDTQIVVGNGRARRSRQQGALDTGRQFGVVRDKLWMNRLVEVVHGRLRTYL